MLGFSVSGWSKNKSLSRMGKRFLKLRLATTESYLDRNNTRQERTEWHRVTLWGKRAEALAKFLTKGERIFVEGRISTSSYEKDGEKRYSTEVVANNIILAGRGKGGDREFSDTGGGGGGGGFERRGGGGGGGGGGRDNGRQPSAPPADDFGGGGDYAGGADDEIPF